MMTRQILKIPLKTKIPQTKMEKCRVISTKERRIEEIRKEKILYKYRVRANSKILKIWNS